MPVRVNDIADVEVGHEIRRGAVTADGRGEAVMGLGFMLMGENTDRYTNLLKDKLSGIRENLPPGVDLVTMYDRTELVDSVMDTVRKNLFEGGLLVVAVLFCFSELTSRIDRCLGDSSFYAVCLHRDVAIRDCRQLIEFGSVGLRIGC